MAIWQHRKRVMGIFSPRMRRNSYLGTSCQKSDPAWTDRYKILLAGCRPGRNNACQFLWRSVKGFWCGEGSNFGLFHPLDSSALKHSRTTVRVCDRKLQVAYNAAFRRLFREPRWCSASRLFVYNNLQSFDAVVRKLMYFLVVSLQKWYMLIQAVLSSDIFISYLFFKGGVVFCFELL